MLVQQVTSDEIVNKVALLVADKLNDVDERLRNVEIMLSSLNLDFRENVNERIKQDVEKIQHGLEEVLNVFIEDLERR